MAISSQTTFVSYTGNASTVTPYPVTFRYDEAAWVTVEEIEADGTITPLSLGTDFTLGGNGSTTTGTVITSGRAISGTSTLRISRDTALTQTVSLAVNGVLPSSVIEAEFDKITMAQLDQKRRQSAGDARSLRLPDGETAAELPAASLRAGEVLFFNASTGAVETKTPDEILALSSGVPDGIGLPSGGPLGYFLKALGGGTGNWEALTQNEIQNALNNKPAFRESAGVTAPIPARKAAGYVAVVATTSLAGTNVTIGGVTYTWTAGAPAAPNQVQVGALPSNSSFNLRAAIANGSGGGLPHPTVDSPAIVNYNGTIGVIAKTAGPAGNDIPISATGPSTSIIVGAFSGGADAAEALPAAFQAPGKPGFLNPLNLPTPDGQPSVTHPSVVHVPGGWNGYEWWMAMTPWPDGARELPNILASHDGANWIVPPGLTNPIISNAEVRTYDDGDGQIYGYSADTHLLLLQDGTMAVYFIMAHDVPVVGSSNGDSEVFRMTSTDGITWTDPVSCIPSIAGGRNAAHGRGSPCVMQLPDGTFVAYTVTVQAPANVTRWTSPDGVDFTFAQQITPPPTGPWAPWHIDCQYVSGKYHMLVNTLAVPSPLYYIQSDDGITWAGDLTNPAIPDSGAEWDSYRKYRSCLVARPGYPVLWDVYVSGMSPDSIAMAGYPYGGKPWNIGLYRSMPLSATPPDVGRSRTRVLFPLTAHLYTSGDNAAAASLSDGTLVSVSAGGAGAAATDAKDGWGMARMSANTSGPVLQSTTFSVPWQLEGTFYGVADNDGSVMLLFGAAYNLQTAYVAGGTNNPFAASKGVGIQFAQPGATGNQKVRIVYHDGTTAKQSDWHDLGVAPAFPIHHAFRLSSNGGGTYQLRIASGVVATMGKKWPKIPTAPALTITDGPTGTSTNSSDTAIWWMAQADGTTNPNYLVAGVMERLELGWP